MSKNIELSETTLRLIDHIISITDASSDETTYSESDIVAIAIKLFELSSMTKHMYLPAVEVFNLARNSWLKSKNTK